MDKTKGRAANTVLVTGGAGFIGSHICDELRARDYSVKNFDIWANPMQDIRNPWAILEATKDVDAIMHLAAEPFIPYGGQDPTLFVETNINGTLNVLNAAAERKLRILVWSSSEIYGTQQPSQTRARFIQDVLGMDEYHPTLPHSIYAVTKLAADRLAYTFHKEKDLPVTIVRQFNCYGPRETQPYVIPSIIEQVDRSRVIILGNIEAERDFTYVTDAARAGVDLLECEEAIGEVVNVGSGTTRSISEILDDIWHIMRPGEDITLHQRSADRMRPYDVDRLLCDSRKLEGLIDWRPKIEWEKGLEKTVKYYKENGSWSYRHKRGESK